MVNYSQRFVAEYAWIKRILADGLLGQPVMAISHKFDRIYVPTRMIAWAAETSPIYFMSSHDLDLLHWYLQADPVAVVAQDAKGVLAAQGIDVHDGLNAMIRFEGGAIGNIHSSWIYPDSYPHMADGHLQIIGSLGTLSLHNGRRRIEIHHAKGSVEQVFSGPHTADEVDGRIAGAFVDSVRCFLACIRDGREPETAPRHVLPMCHAQAAMITSLRTGSPVAVQ
jgi:predicted dehydrogenase